MFVKGILLLGPKFRYESDVKNGIVQADASQIAAVEMLQDVFDALVAVPKVKSKSLLFSLLSKKKAAVPITGVYLWGGVGRGKTYLMDLFFDSLPGKEKLRTHFHRFMRRVHREMGTLKGQKNPLERVADRIAGEAKVICFDEFFVKEITDAMILANLFSALFDRGVTLVTTSNIPPSKLYENGLQRENFVPVIGLLEKHTKVHNLDGKTDYRLRALQQAALYYAPLDDMAEDAMAACFQRLATNAAHDRQNVAISIEGRDIDARRESDDVVWFDFSALCEGPRSQMDYIVLAQEYHAVLLSNTPQLDDSRLDQARRFMYLVDEFYDRNVKLIVSAEVPLAELYVGKRFAFEFERTQSRLLEMQSQDYLEKAHRF